MWYYEYVKEKERVFMEEKKNNKGDINNTPKKEKRKKERSNIHYKNLILMLAALILFIYAGLISVVPSIITKTFNKEEFGTKTYDATSIITNIDGFQYRIKPNLHAVMEITNLEMNWIGNQKLFDAKYIEIETKNPLAIITKNFNIDTVKVTNANFSNQLIIDDKTKKLENKLKYITPNFNPEKYGAKTITIKPGNVTVKNFLIAYITPTTYNEERIAQETYTKEKVKEFLLSNPIANIKIK